jgi:hypothetical protein
MDEASVNIAPPAAGADGMVCPLWEQWAAKDATGRFEVLTGAEGRGLLRISNSSGRLAWRSCPRKIEPRKEYRLQAQMRGTGRLMLRWIRLETGWDSLKEGRFHLLEVQLGEVYSEEVSGAPWTEAAAGGVAPRDATHCRIFLEAVSSGGTTEFRNVFLDGLGVDPLEIQYCQAGYHPDAVKTAIVQVRGEAKGGRFALIDENGKEAFEEEMTAIDKPGWGRSFWLADFSQFSREGNYALAVEASGRRRRTKFLPIRKDVYARLAELTLHWFHTQRCGAGVTRWHAECHLDDGAVREEDQIKEFRAAAGGWHEGGGYNKETQHLWIGIHCLTHLYEKGGGTGNGFGGELPDALEECRWAAEYLLRIATGDGRFAAYVRNDRSEEYFGPPEEETDNTQRSGDERTIGPPCDWIVAALSSYSLANYARVIEDMQADLARRCYQEALRTFAVLQQSKKPEDPIDLHGGAALLCIALWRAKGEQKYREECSWRILSILQKQKEEGIFAPEGGYAERTAAPLLERISLPDMAEGAVGIQYAPAPFVYLHALLCYLERNIDDALALEIRGALDKFLMRIKECAGVSAFGQMGEWTLARDAVNFPVMPRGHNTYYLASAYLLAKASALLDRTDIGTIAQRQLEWVLGRNVRGTCMVCGAGHREPGAYYTRYAVHPEHRDGYQPGGVVDGIIGGDGRDYPVDFPYLDIHSPGPEGAHSGFDADPRTNQYWLPNCAWFVLACGEVTKMLAARSVPEPDARTSLGES